ncbi:hypothetical protein AAIR98_001086 [Elusimicrobium simillimum]|uniref:hypothetical protein n=1 Tax=Elusimicrobium simillimum TaxID=3143438 RepID=UPI003C6F6AF0
MKMNVKTTTAVLTALILFVCAGSANAQGWKSSLKNKLSVAAKGLDEAVEDIRYTLIEPEEFHTFLYTTSDSVTTFFNNNTEMFKSSDMWQFKHNGRVVKNISVKKKKYTKNIYPEKKKSGINPPRVSKGRPATFWKYYVTIIYTDNTSNALKKAVDSGEGASINPSGYNQYLIENERTGTKVIKS